MSVLFARYCGCIQHLPLFLQVICPPPPPPSGVVSDSLSLPSYKEYPVHRPFINTLVHHTPQTRTHQSCHPLSPSKAFPETSSAGIFNLYVCGWLFSFCKVSIQVLWCFSAPWLHHVQHDAALLECLSCTDIYSFFHMILSKTSSPTLLFYSTCLNHDYNLNIFESYQDISICYTFS